MVCGSAHPFKHVHQGSGAGQIDRELVLAGIGHVYVGVVDTRHHEVALQVKETRPRLLLPQYRCIASHGENFMRPDRDSGGPLSMPLTQTYTGKHITVVINCYHRLGGGCEQRSRR